ncbi:MAG: HD domain-containing protein [Candidatus Lokiarchaeota archaeon]|nr:HD domain-containing protein [Candidatus Lokiarchaeota archaeon]
MVGKVIKEKEFISMVKEFSQRNSDKDDVHGFDHVKRVFENSVYIGMSLNANLFVLKIASLLHDIGRKFENKNLNGKNHADISAEMSNEFLKNLNYAISPEDFSNIEHCIRAHSFSNDIKPMTLEAKILSDSDKLDALGAIGIYRVVAFSKELNRGIPLVLKHFENKILKLKDKLWLDFSKKIASKRHELVLGFYEAIKQETTQSIWTALF